MITREEFIEFLNVEWFGNSGLRILIACATFLLLLLLFRFVIPLFLRQAEKLVKRSSIAVDDAVIALLKNIPSGVLFLLSLAIGISMLSLSETVDMVNKAIILIILTVVGISIIRQLIEFAIMANVPHLRTMDNEQLPTILRLTILLILWGFGILLILSNLGINVLSLIAGLGIGGIAVALALQNILSDMFSSFAIYLDKPFREGDFIVVGQHMGVVKKVGLKTTRIQALQGEEIVISNQELTSTRIQNFKRMNERRIVFTIGVTYDATPTQIRKSTEIIKEIIESKELARFDRAHFAQFGNSSLNIEVVYYVLTSEYNTYMDLQQEMNLEIMERLQNEGLEFAFPTQTVHIVNKDEVESML